MTRLDSFTLTDPQHRRVLELLATGKTGNAIGTELYLSLDAVKTRLRRIYRQLGAHNAAQAVHVAHQRGLLRFEGDGQCAWHTLQIRDVPDSFTGERAEVTCPEECRQLPPGAVCWYVHEPFRHEWPTETGTYRIRPYHHTVQSGEDGDVEVEFQVQIWDSVVPGCFPSGANEGPF